MNENKDIIELTSLRGFAAIFIVIHHAASVIAPSIGEKILAHSHFVAKSYLWVDFFFLLSGFVLAYVYHQKRLTARHYHNFIVARFARIYPLHLSMLLLFLLSEIIHWWLLGSAFNGPNNLQNFLRNLFLVQAVQTSPTSTSWNHPAWSISVEWISYITFPFLLYFLLRFKQHLRLAAIVIAFLILLLINEITPYKLDVTGILGIARCMMEASIGAVLALHLLDHKGKITLPFTNVFLWLTGILLAYSLHKNAYDVLSVALLSVFLLFVAAENESLKQNVIRRFLRLSFFHYLGKVSYSTYLVHIFIFSLIKIGFSASGHKIQNMDEAMQYLPFILAIVLSIGIAPLFYHLIENPMRKLIRQKLSTTSP